LLRIDLVNPWIITNLLKQWAADTTKSGEMSDPPQAWPPLKRRLTCQGHWPSLEAVPPMILETLCCLPQSEKTKL